MQAALRIGLAWIVAVVVTGAFQAGAQAPGVPICDQAALDAQSKNKLQDLAKGLVNSGEALSTAQVKQQLYRTSCQLALPAASTMKLPAREVWIAARHSHLRVGWSYLCDKCSKWHLKLAGGYALTANGAVATCFHVIEPNRDMREGGLVAVDEEGKVLPVAGVLAASRENDACIVRVLADGLKPLPLNTNVYPGDAAYCYSDPAEHRDYFSAGIVNRFYQPTGSRPTGTRSSAAVAPTRINVSTDWAPGSSGSAVLDDCGNAIGHVSTISTVRDESTAKTEDTHLAKPAAIVFHEAVSARDVLRLIKPLR